MQNLEDELLCKTIDYNVTFKNHINSICKKESQKLNVLARIAPYMNIKKGRPIIKSSELECSIIDVLTIK